MNIILQIHKFSRWMLGDIYHKRVLFLFVIVINSIFSINISYADTKTTLSSSQLEQWEIIFPTMFKLNRYLPKTGKFLEVESKPRVERLKKLIEEGKRVLNNRFCHSANAVLKAISCGTTRPYLLDYTKDERIKRTKLSGNITPDGKYIIVGGAGTIEEIATGKLIDLSEIDKDGNIVMGLDYPTTPKPDGTFAFTFLDEQGRPGGIGEANLYEMIKLNGRGYKVKVITNSGKLYGQVTAGQSGYYGNGNYIFGNNGLDNQLVNWEHNTLYGCNVSHDGAWAVCTLSKKDTKKTGWILINTRERKVVKHWPDLKAKNAIWVWVGPVDQHPGFVR